MNLRATISVLLLVAASHAAIAATTVTMTPGDNLSSLTNLVHSDTTIVFPAGDYHLTREVGIYNRNNLTLRGEPGARIVRAFDPTNPSTKVVLIFQGCENLTIEGFTVTTDNPVNTCGTVVSTSKLYKNFVVEVDEACPMTGNEKFASIDSYDANGMPDYHLAVVGDVSYSLGSGRRITVSHKPENLTVGQRVCFRNAIYIDQTFYLSNDRNIVFRDIEVERSPTMPVTLQPGCENATFERFNVRLKSGDNSCYAANADGIHIAGLSGRLTMTDCHFDGLGDDALNVHTVAGKVTGWNSGSGTLTVTSRASYQPGPYWCKAGSELTFYGSNMMKKGSAAVTAYSFADGVGTVTLSNVEGTIAVNDFVDVESQRPSVRISNCSVRNTRARGFLLQSKDMIVENCSFTQLALPGLLIAPSVSDWYEMGPSSRVIVRCCTFTKCCSWSGSSANTGALSVKVGHDSSGGGYSAGVHRDFAIYGNTFTDCSPRGIYLDSVNGAYLNGNTGANAQTVACSNTGATFEKYVASDGILPVAADEPFMLDQPLGADITKTGAGTLTLALPSGSGRVNLAEGTIVVPPSCISRIGAVAGGTTLIVDGGQTIAANGAFSATAANPVRIELNGSFTQAGSTSVLTVPTTGGAVPDGSIVVVGALGTGLVSTVHTETVGGVQTVYLDVSEAPHYTLADDSFESCTVGQAASTLPGWSGSGEVCARSIVMSDPPTFPLNDATHLRTLAVDGEATRTYDESFARDNQSVDMLVEVVRRSDELPSAADMASPRQLSVTFDRDGRLNIWHPDANGNGHWTPLDFGTGGAFVNGEIVRLTMVFDYQTVPGVAFGQIRVNGSCGVLWDDVNGRLSPEGVRSPSQQTAKGSWFRLFPLAADNRKVSELNISGACEIDDVVLSCHEKSVAPAFDMGTVTGVDYSGDGVSGWIPFSVFDDRWGLARDPDGDVDGDGCTNGDEILKGTNPFDPFSCPNAGTLLLIR